MRSRILTALLVLGLCALFPGTGALADGDPASDVLLGENVFYPYSPATSTSLQRALNTEVAAAHRAGLALKVALVGSAVDLGAIPELFGQPQRYAQFLDQEISFHTLQPLLVVMPAGFGVRGMAPAASAALSGLPAPGKGSDALARAALAAVPRIASASGHRLGRPGAPGATTGPSSGAGGSTAVIVIVLAVAAILTAGALLAVRRREARRGEPG